MDKKLFEDTYNIMSNFYTQPEKRELICTHYFKDGTKKEKYTNSIQAICFEQRILHREDGPAIEFAKEEDKKFNSYFINGEKAPNYIIKKILNYKKQKTLTPYLLDNNSCIRFYAEKKIKELENE